MSYTLSFVFLAIYWNNHHHLLQAVRQDFKGKISVVIYVIAILLAFVSTWISGGLYVLVAIIWLVPDRRIENVMEVR